MIIQHSLDETETGMNTCFPMSWCKGISNKLTNKAAILLLIQVSDFKPLGGQDIMAPTCYLVGSITM